MPCTASPVTPANFAATLEYDDGTTATEDELKALRSGILVIKIPVERTVEINHIYFEKSARFSAGETEIQKGRIYHGKDYWY